MRPFSNIVLCLSSINKLNNVRDCYMSGANGSIDVNFTLVYSLIIPPVFGGGKCGGWQVIGGIADIAGRGYSVIFERESLKNHKAPSLRASELQPAKNCCNL